MPLVSGIVLQNGERSREGGGVGRGREEWINWACDVSRRFFVLSALF